MQPRCYALRAPASRDHSHSALSGYMLMFLRVPESCGAVQRFAPPAPRTPVPFCIKKASAVLWRHRTAEAEDVFFRGTTLLRAVRVIPGAHSPALSCLTPDNGGSLRPHLLRRFAGSEGSFKASSGNRFRCLAPSGSSLKEDWDPYYSSSSPFAAYLSTGPEMAQ